jgi:hypothetical protein
MIYAADEVVQSSPFLLPAIITAIGTGAAAIIGVAPGMIRAIREDEAEDLRAMVRRLYYALKDDPVWILLPEDIKKDLRSTSEDVENAKKPKKVRRWQSRR